MLTESQLEQFRRDGFTLIPGFLDKDQVRCLETAACRLLDQWQPEYDQLNIFTTDQRRTEQLRAKDRYFLESGDKVRFFVEEQAVHQDRLVVDKRRAVNKIGHALHSLVPECGQVTFSSRVSQCCQQLGMGQPAVCQSMFIFKQPGIGGVVSSHQDATFLHVQPERALLGFWLALEPADVDNGCLWFVPGSHRGPVRRRFVRSGTEYPPALVFEGQAASGADDDQFVPVPAAPGDCVLISGLVQHRSDANTSTRSRHVYTFHVYDQLNARYSRRNWLQPSPNLPFPLLYRH